MNRNKKAALAVGIISLVVGVASNAHAASTFVFGPVEALSADSVTVLGQSYSLDKVSSISSSVSVGTLVLVEGLIDSRAKGGATAKSLKIAKAPYVPGASDVALSGVVTNYNAATGVVFVGDLAIYAIDSASLDLPNLKVGSQIEVVGRQAVPLGSVWATELRVGTQAIEGTGRARSTQAIEGTGRALSTQAIEGTGRALSTQAIEGTGRALSTQAIEGTGRALSTQAIEGTGRSVSTQAIEGTGRALSTQAIEGTGRSVSTQAIEGTGRALSTQAIEGTGRALSTQAIEGTGRALSTQAIEGTGRALSTQAIEGTGRALSTQAIEGTGRAAK